MGTAVVLGGGISGLAATYYLLQLARQQFSKVILLEKSKRVGGWVQTTKYPDGTVFEHGPRSLRPAGIQGKNTLLLAEELGLSSDILPVKSSSPAAKNRYLYVSGKLCALPNSAFGLLRTQQPFTHPLIKDFMYEMKQERSSLDDESVHDFVTRRFGRELADIAVSSMCRGIYAGDSCQLSVRSCFPDLYRWEKEFGSVIAGFFRSSQALLPVDSKLVSQAKTERWASWSLRSGLQQLTDRLQEMVTQTAEIRLDSPCIGLEPTTSHKIKVKTADGGIVADQVFSAVYAKDLACLLPESLSTLRETLLAIPAVDVYVVNLEFSGQQLPVQGFGHLLPPSESGPLLGIVYDSCPFPEHNRHGDPSSTRLTVMMGGAWFKDLQHEIAEFSDSRITEYATNSARKQLGISADPIRVNISFQKNCIPQYVLGHHEKLTTIRGCISNSGLPISLLGSSYLGASINDCIFNARQAVEALIG